MKKFIYLFPALALLSCGSESTEENPEHLATDTLASVQETEEEMIIDISLNKILEIPSACKVEGDLVDAYSWKDLNGTNYFIRTLGKVEEGGDLEGLPTQSQYLYAYHYTENAKGEFQLVEDIVDFVKDCEFDIILGHELDAISLTDLDSNQVGEIAFIYRTSCTSDVSPSTQKLILLENGTKYALRGSTEVMGMGGEFEPDQAFDSAPDGFQAHAESMWKDHIVEFDFEL